MTYSTDQSLNQSIMNFDEDNFVDDDIMKEKDEEEEDRQSSSTVDMLPSEKSSEKKSDNKKPTVENDDSSVADFIRPLKKKKTNEKCLKIDESIYKRNNVRTTQFTQLGSNSGAAKELTKMFYKNNPLLPTPTKNETDHYIVQQVKQLFYEFKGTSVKVSITKPSSILILDALRCRFDLLFQQARIIGNSSDNKTLNKALFNAILLIEDKSVSSSNNQGNSSSPLPIHLVQKGGKSKRLQSFISNSTRKEESSSGDNLHPLTLFVALASLNPGMSHVKGSSPALFCQPASYETFAYLHKIYLFLKDFTKSHPTAKKTTPEGGGDDESKKKRTEEHREITKKTFTHLQNMFQADKLTVTGGNTDKTVGGKMFVVGKGATGLFKRYGFERSAQFNKYILEAFICLFLKEIAYEIFIFLLSRGATQINTEAVKWALKDYGYNC